MTSNISPSSNKNKDLKNRLIILEKFIELKSNECAYYRTKVHLMQMSSLSTKTLIAQENKNIKQSSSEDSSITSENQLRTLSLQRKSFRKKNLNHLPFSSSLRHHRKTCAQNQNYYEENHFHSNEKTSLSINEKNLIEQTLLSYINKHFQQSAHDKNIQCNDNDFHQSSHTVLMLQLPRRFIKSLIAQQKKPIIPKLKVHISSELLKKLFQSIHVDSKSNEFTIQSQFGTISACINHEDLINKQECQGIHAKAEIKTHHEHRLPTIRHIATRTRSDISSKHRRKKRHLHKSNSTSHEEIYSKKSSSTNQTQTIEILSSSDHRSYEKIKRNKRRF